MGDDSFQLRCDQNRDATAGLSVQSGRARRGFLPSVLRRARLDLIAEDQDGLSAISGEVASASRFVPEAGVRDSMAGDVMTGTRVGELAIKRRHGHEAWASCSSYQARSIASQSHAANLRELRIQPGDLHEQNTHRTQ